MKEVVLSKPFTTEEEYFAFEEQSEVKHEYINSTLFEMSGVSKYHNAMVINLAVLLRPMSKLMGKVLFIDGYKVRTPDGNFFYPDVVLSELQTAKYYTLNPVLLAEVFSDSTRTFDLTDKFIQYRKFPTLQYYLCLDPERVWVHLYYCTDNKDGIEWNVDILTKLVDIINLPKLGISISLQDIYQA